jgi:hypothetical protein
MTQTTWTYYLNTNVKPVLFRQSPGLRTYRWDAPSRSWVEIDHMYLLQRLWDGDVYLDEISAAQAAAITTGSAAPAAP